MKINKKIHRIISILLVVVMILNSSVILHAMETEQQKMTEITELEETETVKETKETAVTDPESEAETELSMGQLEGIICYQEGKQIAGMEVNLYERASYIYDDPDTEVREDAANIARYTVLSQLDGSYRIANIKAGEYRIEFVNINTGIDLSEYEVVPVESSAGYEVKDGQDLYTAYVDLFTIEAEECLDLVLREKKQPDTALETEEEVQTETEDKESETEAAKPQTDESEAPMTVADLKDAGDDVAMSAVEKTGVKKQSKQSRSAAGNGWSFDMYYVNESSKYDVEKKQDFNLKYQMELRTNTNLAPGEVEIRVKYELLKDRNGKSIYPSDIAVPKGTKENPKVTGNPLNYYLDGEDIVFFNYSEIEAGTTVAFQVLYKKLIVMNIVDETAWTFEPQLTIKGEQVTADPVTGKVNTEVVLSSVTKKPYKHQGKSYTPGLYSEKQVRSWIGGSIPEPYASNFSDYKYVVWEINVRGSASQHWDLYLQDQSSVKGEAGGLVGYRYLGNNEVISGGEYDQYLHSVKDSSVSAIGEVFYAVTAYPVSAGIEPGTMLENNIDVVLHPHDNIDADQKKSAAAKWPYEDYNWKYSGDVASIHKSGGGDYSGWIDVYEKAVENQEDQGAIPFSISSSYRGYSMVTNTTGDELGKDKEGHSYKLTTTDEQLYASPDGDTSKKVLLDGSDYYFSSVNITQTDSGYDIWEDQGDKPKEAGDLLIYAWFEDSTDWEEVTRIAWKESGTLSYAFTAEQIARGPWRVKAEHETANYSTSCQINLNVMIRHQSEKIQGLIQNNSGMQALVLENVSNLVGQGKAEGENADYYEEVKDSDTWSARLRRMGQQAKAFKCGEAVNDPINERVKVNYSLAAYDGYHIYSREAANYLKANGIESPGRNEVVFYDLLPYGVRFDASVPITAGRLTNIHEPSVTKPVTWDTAQITATVDPSTDVITNYNNTGRTMVVIHVVYEGVDPASYTSGYWLEGFGVNFGAYYVWKDLGIVNDAPNISAFMPEVGDHRPLLGAAGQVFKDNGDVPASVKEDYKYFGANINGDASDDDVLRVLYAKASVAEDVAVYSKSEVLKLVRANDDKYGAFVKSTDVEKEKDYTYDITVSSAGGRLENTVVYDILEYGAITRSEDETEVFESDWWYGEFKGVNTTALEMLGIEPVIYYHADRETAKTKTDASQDPIDVLNAANGWIKASDWTGELKDVQAVAVDLTWTKTGEKFRLESMENMSFQIQMTAPASVAAGKVYAYNNAAFYSYNIDTKNDSLESGNATKVKLAETGVLEVIKEFDGEVPANAQNWEFLFKAYSLEGTKQEVYANKKYELYKKDVAGEWEKQKGLYATDVKGEFYLKADEMAMFTDSLKAVDLIIEEENNPFWKVELSETGTKDNRTLTFKNRYQSVLYAQKKLAAVPAEKSMEAKETEFTFKLSFDGVPAADAKFYYVDKARTDGGIPKILGDGQTDANGEFKIKQGEVIVFSAEVGTSYELQEVGGYGDGTDWICEKPGRSGTLSQKAVVAEITNVYKWKELHLKKEIVFKNASEVTQEFTFQLRDENGVPVTTQNRYTVWSGEQNTGIEGNLDANGSFTLACAGQTIRIEGLEAKVTYQICETESGEEYEPVNDLVEVTMPLNGTSENATIVNQYIKRSLYVTKEVFYDPDDYDLNEQEDYDALEALKAKEFEMIAEINGEPLADHPYTAVSADRGTRSGQTDADGKFTLKHGETATFAEAGLKGMTFVVTELPDPEDQYVQMTPANNQPHQGVLGSAEESSVTFVNGKKGSGSQLILGKEYVPAENSPEDLNYGRRNEDYVYGMQYNGERERFAVTITLEIKDGDRTFIWPEEDTRVTVIDQINGNSTEKITWKKGSPLTIEPWKRVIVKGLKEDWEYTFSESEADQHRIVDTNNYGGHWGSSRDLMQIDAKNNPIQGKVSESSTAILQNEVDGMYFNSQIQKRMTLDSEVVPEGAKLVWQLEKLNWEQTNETGRYVYEPVGGVSYVVADGKGITSSEIQKTGSDGKIVLQKTASGYPSVYFATLNGSVYTGDGGEYRIVEVLEESDDTWGYLAGYAYYWSAYDEYDQYGGSGNVFVNSNAYEPLKIEKTMEVSSDTVFTMVLKKITSTYYMLRDPSEWEYLREAVEAGNYTQISDIAQRIEAIANIPYTVYDSASGQEVGTGVTTKSGEIKLKAGQYVIVNLPKGTLWTLSEQNKQPYNLKEMSGSAHSQFIKFDDNLMLIYQGGGRATLDPEDFEEIMLTQEMVETGGIYSYNDGRLLDFNTQNEYVRNYIVYQNKPYKVVGIGESAFSGMKNMRYIYLEDGIKTIGSKAFADSGINQIDLYHVEKVAEDAFEGCQELLYIHIMKPEGSIPGAPWGAPREDISIHWYG